MKRKVFILFLTLVFLPGIENSFSQVPIEVGDPPNNEDIPDFFKSGLNAIEEEVNNIKKGDEIIGIETETP